MKHPRHSTCVMAMAVSLVMAAGGAGCTPKSGTRVPTDTVGLQSITSLRLTVTTRASFTVTRTTNPVGTAIGGFLAHPFGLVTKLIGAGADAVRASSRTNELAGSFARLAQSLDPRSALAEQIREALLQSRRFERLDTAQTGMSQSDGLLALTIEEWGLRSCIGASSPDQVQLVLYLHGILTAQADGRTIWERDELHLDPTCLPFDQFLDQDSLLADRLTDSVTALSGTLVNRILYP